MNVLFLLLIINVVPGLLSETTENKPLVLNWDGKNLKFPLTYFLPKSIHLYHYCPDETDIQEQLLVPINDKESYCKNPVKPLLMKSEELSISCDVDGKSMYYDFVYRMRKPTTQENSENKESPVDVEYQELVVYRFCYNHARKETIFSYFLMISPYTLKSQYLQEQCNEVQEMDTDGYQLLDKNFIENLKNAYTSHELKPLMLVSPFDMAFSVWKKTAYNYFNVKPAWGNIVEMWNIINDYLRNVAIDVARFIINEEYENSHYQELDMIQISGGKDELMLDGKKIYLDKKETVVVPKYIWKLAYVKKENTIVAIILHNIPDKSYYKESDKLCENNERSRKKFNILENINNNYEWGKFVEFCDHKVITDEYYLPERLEFLLKKEFLLPLVMMYYEDKYQLPETYHGLTKLADGSHQKIIFFCPAETKQKNVSQEQCLFPNESDTPYCRKSVESFNVESKLTGINCDFSLRDMVYQICAADDEDANIIRSGGTTLPTHPYDQVVYSFCLHPTERSHFTYHRIISLNLFNNENLQNERLIRFQSYDYREVKRDFFDYFNNLYATETYKADYYRTYYMVRIWLVPPSDMIFPLFKKATYHIYNMTVAWENTAMLKLVVHQRLRYEALLKNQELIQINGVMGDSVLDKSVILYRKKEKVPKYLWTIVYNPEMTHSIAIVIHNIPHVSYLTESDKLCETSVCNLQNWDLNMVSKFNSAAYCCNSNVLTQKHGFPDTPHVMEIEELFWPLVLTFHRENYQFPESFISLEINVNEQSNKQTLFCPLETNDLMNIDEYCLVPNEHIVPYCRKPLKYLWVRNETSEIGCNGEHLVDFSIVYRLCFQNMTNDQEIFRVCYDRKNKKTRYTFHQINSPALLKEKMLEKQQKMDFPIDTNNYLTPEEDFKSLKLAFETKKIFKFKRTAKEVNSLTDLMLTSPTHMAFASLLEPTYHFVNLQPTWPDIQLTWNCVNEKLLNIASSQNLKFVQINGSSEELLEMDGNKIYLDDGENVGVPNYFWKVVYNESMEQSVAFVFHNLPRKYIFPLNSNKLCTRRSDLCDIREIHGDFSATVHYAYCCESKVITEKFNLPQVNSKLKIGGMKCNLNYQPKYDS